MSGLECAFFGSIARDPELKTSKGGKPYLSVSVGVQNGKDADGKELLQWVRVTCFGEQAEAIAARAKKGSRLYVEGALSTSEFSGQDGAKRFSLEVRAFKCELVGISNIGRNKQWRDTGSELADKSAGQRKQLDAAGFNDDALPF